MCNKYKPLQFINTFLVISHLFVCRKERKEMKDEKTHYGAMNKSTDLW